MKHRSFKKKQLYLIAAAVLAVAVISVYSLAEKKADYSQIVGQWVRASGGYVLDIQNVQPDGKLQAAYLNPKSINVSQAQVNDKTGTIELFVELRDRHYPGSYYTLTYDTQSDRLVGIYHQLVIGRNYNVVFSRKQSSG